MVAVLHLTMKLNDEFTSSVRLHQPSIAGLHQPSTVNKKAERRLFTYLVISRLYYVFLVAYQMKEGSK